MNLLFAQITSEAVKLQHNYEYLSYGLIAAWVVLTVYVLMLVSRERNLKREIASLKAMVEERERGEKPRQRGPAATA
jgi:hypothetical protein